MESERPDIDKMEAVANPWTNFVMSGAAVLQWIAYTRELEKALACPKCGANNRHDILRGRISARDWLTKHPCGYQGPDDGQE